MRMISIIEIAWTAGFFEGEAWFGIYNKKCTPVISVSQVQKEPLERLLILYGGSLRPIGGKGKRQNYWRWEVYGPRAAGIMMTIYSLMSPKRQLTISDIIKSWSTSPNNTRKLKWLEVHNIREEIKTKTQAGLAKKYGVSRSAIAAVVTNKTWRAS